MCNCILCEHYRSTKNKRKDEPLSPRPGSPQTHPKRGRPQPTPPGKKEPKPPAVWPPRRPAPKK